MGVTSTGFPKEISNIRSFCPNLLKMGKRSFYFIHLINVNIDLLFNIKTELGRQPGSSSRTRGTAQVLKYTLPRARERAREEG